MSTLQEAVQMEARINEARAQELNPQLAAAAANTAPPQNNVVGLTVVLIPLILALLFVFAIPVTDVAEKRRTGMLMKILSIFLILMALVGLYITHQKINVVSMVKSFGSKKNQEAAVPMMVES